MYKGISAIEYLAEEVKKTDPQSSSHWSKYHSSFGFDGQEFSGLEGFGGSRSRNVILDVYDWILQLKFRRMGGRDLQFINRAAREITKSQGRTLDLDVLRQVLTLSFLQRNIPNELHCDGYACVIGDGFASMTSLLLATRSVSNVALVNLSKTLLVDLWYLKQWMGLDVFNQRVMLVTSIEALTRALIEHEGGGCVIAIQAKDHSLLRLLPLTLAINIASMQEMNPPVISAYFDDLRQSDGSRPLPFYCCNREMKKLPDGTVTRFLEYPWMVEDRILVDALCPWHQQWYSYAPPFYRPYDGPIWHRLVMLSKYDEEKAGYAIQGSNC